MRTWQRRYELPAPRPGDLAPDFEVRDADDENPAPLSDFQGNKPAVLIFGRLSRFGAHIRRGIHAPQTSKEHRRVAYASGLDPLGFKLAEFNQEEE